MIDAKNRILETRVDRDKASPSGYTHGSGMIAYACVAECRSREALFRWRLQKLECQQLKLKMLTKKVMAGIISISDTDTYTYHYDNILAVNNKIQHVTSRVPEEWKTVYAKGGGKSYLSKKKVFQSAAGTNQRLTTLDDWKNSICMITRNGSPLPSSNRHHIGYVSPSHEFVNAKEMNIRMGDVVHPVPSQEELDSLRPFDMVKLNLHPGLRFWTVILQVGSNGFRGVACFSGPVEHQLLHGVAHGTVLDFCHEHIMDTKYGGNATPDIFIQIMKNLVKDVSTVYVDDQGCSQTWEMVKDVVPQFVKQLLPQPAATDPTAAWASPLQDELVAGITSLLEFWNEAFAADAGEDRKEEERQEERQDKRQDERQDEVQGLTCTTCNAAHTSLNQLKICRCRQAYYCNSECQKKDLVRHKKEHKKFCKQIKKKAKSDDVRKEEAKDQEEVDLELDVNAGTLKEVTPVVAATSQSTSEQRQLSVQFALRAAEAAQIHHDVHAMLEFAENAIAADPSYFAGYTMRARFQCFQGHMHEAMVDFDQAYDCALRENTLKEADGAPWSLNVFRLQCRRAIRLEQVPGYKSNSNQHHCHHGCCDNGESTEERNETDNENDNKTVESFESVWMRNIMRDPVKRQHWESLDEREREQTKEKMKNLMGMMGLTR